MRTIEQLRGWASMLIEMQMQRVIMLRKGEEMQGGAPDAALSQELDLHPVGSAVNSARNDGPQLLVPVSLPDFPRLGEAWKAVGWLLDGGLPVRTLGVTWSFERIALSLPRGLEWYVEFWEKLTV